MLLIETGVTGHLHMHFPSGAGEGSAEHAYARELDETLRAHRASGQRVALAPHWSDRSRLAYDGDAPSSHRSRPSCGSGARRSRRAHAAEAYLETIEASCGSSPAIRC